MKIELVILERQLGTSHLLFFSAKIVVHLHPAPANKEPGPFQSSKNSYIKLSFKEHGQIEVSLYVNKMDQNVCLNIRGLSRRYSVM